MTVKRLVETVALLALASACGSSGTVTRPTPSASAASPVASAATSANALAPPGLRLADPGIDSWNDWSPDGRHVVLAGAIVDLDTGRVLPSGCENGVSWGGNTHLACRTADSGVEVTDVASGRRQVLDECRDAELFWGQGGRYLACTGKASVFDADAFTAIALPGPVMWRAFVADGSMVRLNAKSDASDFMEGTVQLWDLEKRAAVGEAYSFPLMSTSSLSADRRRHLELLGADAWLTDSSNGTHRRLATDATRFPNAVPDELLSLFAPDGATVAIPIENDGVRLVDVATGTSLGKLRAPGCETPTQVAFSPLGDVVAVGSATAVVCLFDRASSKLLRSWSVPLPRVLGREQTDSQILLLSFAGDGRGLLVGIDSGPSGSSIVSLYRVSSGERISDLAGGNATSTLRQDASGTSWLDGARVDPNLDVRIYPPGFHGITKDGRWACMGDRVASDGIPLPTFEKSAGAMFASTDPTGTKVLGTTGGRARVWSLETGRLLYAP